MDAKRIQRICALFVFLAGPVSASVCSVTNRTTDPDKCIQQIQVGFVNNDLFWFGQNYKIRCPNGPADGYTCENRYPSSLKSLGKRLFPSKEMVTNINTFVDVTYTTTPGEYEGCGHKVKVTEPWTKTIDPLSPDVVYPWYVKNMPEVTWSPQPGALYSLLIYDVGFFSSHAVYTNIQGNDLSTGGILQDYHGPLMSFNIGNPYAFILFRQEASVAPTQAWIDRIRASNFTVEEFMNDLSLTLVGINWVVAKGDIYAAGLMKSRGYLNTCPLFVGEALDKKQRPFLQVPAQLSVSLDLTFMTTDLSYTACCKTYSYNGRTFSPDPIGNTVYSTAETRSEGNLTFSMLKAGYLGQGQASNFTGDIYTLIAIDPDVPNTQVGTESRPLLHMLVLNIMDGKGTVTQPYSGPTPPDTIPHYYFFLLYKHTNQVNVNTITSYAGQGCSVPNRCPWDINKMVADNNMTLVGASWIRGAYDDYVMYRYLQRNNTQAYVDSLCQGVEGYAKPCPAAGSDVIMTSFVLTVIATLTSLVLS